MVIIRMSHRYLHHYLEEGAEARDALCLAVARFNKRRFKVRKTIMTILGSALLATSIVQIATAAEHDNGRKAYREPASISEQFRNSNAYWPAPYAQPDSSRYQNGAESAPAGR